MDSHYISPKTLFNMKYLTLLLLLAQILLNSVTAEETPDGQQQATENEEDASSLSVVNFPGDFSVSDGVMRALTTAGVLVTSVAGLAAILSYLLPMIGFRTCAFFGNCLDDSNANTAYNHQGIASNSVYDQQGFTGYQYGGSYKKRSLEYVGPILKALSAAYDKYGPHSSQRRSNSVPITTNTAKGTANVKVA